jgi:hypothetical protein
MSPLRIVGDGSLAPACLQVQLTAGNHGVASVGR